MGYTTDFFGEFTLTPALSDNQKDYINKFNKTRRMKRDVNKLMDIYKGEHGFPDRTGTPEEIYGKDGQFFVGGGGSYGQDRDESVIDYNTPPGQLTYEERKGMSFDEQWNKQQELIKNGLCQPSLWCQWEAKDNDTLAWDEGEKFYEYEAWLRYLIIDFFEPWGVMVNGEVEWQGEDRDDRGKIVVTNNVLQILEVHITYR
jgi:hypothetical protein